MMIIDNKVAKLLHERMLKTHDYTMGTRFSVEQSLRFHKEYMKASIKIHLPDSSLTVFEFSVSVFSSNTVFVRGTKQDEEITPLVHKNDEEMFQCLENVFRDFEEDLAHLTRFANKNLA